MERDWLSIEEIAALKGVGIEDAWWIAYGMEAKGCARIEQPGGAMFVRVTFVQPL